MNIIQKTQVPNDLFAAVRHELQERVEQGTIELPMLPANAARVVSMAGQEDSDAKSLARLITADQALAAQVMRVARSAAYQSSRPINTLQHAISWLGLGEVADIAFTAAVQGRLLNVPGQRPRAQRMWKAAVATAHWAREVAAVARRQSEVTYLCGLLHDVGKPMALLAAADISMLFGMRLSDEQVEALVHEFHAPLGVLLAERWNLPRAVTACIRLWPDWKSAPEHGDEVLVVHLSHHIAELVIEQGAALAREALEDQEIVQALGIGVDRFRSLLERSDWVMSQAQAY